ncbi:nuclear transport factor 2 family protein [Streptomyces sp. NPDC023838]|uniref:nuclear transport factor 2 family protein n=1 Tax=Streptomyces sp. NPDC023838 TaxID=3154325 RepID=UPI0033F53B20
MSVSVNDLLKKYIDVFNETDDVARKSGVTELFTEDAVYSDPMGEVVGWEGIEGYLKAFRQQAPGLIFALGEIKAHHDVVLFAWSAAPEGGAPIASGKDYVLLKDGRIARLHGFFD